jgi:hypothetical protein
VNEEGLVVGEKLALIGDREFLKENPRNHF